MTSNIPDVVPLKPTKTPDTQGTGPELGHRSHHMYTTCTISSETPRLRDHVEVCPIGVHTRNRGHTVPVIDIALRRGDAFEESTGRTDRKMATNDQDAAAAIRVLN